MSSAGDVIDLNVIDSLRELGGGDDEFLNDLIRTFLDETPVILERLHAALANDDAGGIRLNAHSLKGSSAEFGASWLGELCRQLELAGKNGDLDTAPDLLGEIEDEYARVQSALMRLLT